MNPIQYWVSVQTDYKEPDGWIRLPLSRSLSVRPAQLCCWTVHRAASRHGFDPQAGSYHRSGWSDL